MATPTRHLCRSLFQVSRRLPVKRKWQAQCFRQSQWAAPPFRQLSASSFRAADDTASNQSVPAEGAGNKVIIENSGEDDERGEELDVDELEYELQDTTPPDPADYLTPSEPISAEELSEGEIEQMKELLQGQPGDPVGLYNHLMAIAESLEEWKDLDPAIMDQLERDIEDEDDIDFPPDTLSQREIGWHAADEEDDEFAMAEDDDDEHDDSDITSVAHSELELHREIREYTRVIAWDMPLLTNFAKEFKPPSESQPLRFRYTTYMGETHPAAKKVVVQFCTKDLPGLTEAQRIKLIKLVGVRYNPDTDIVKISSEKFEAPAQNKRYLGDLVNKLIDEAKNGADKLEDIPIDLRHHKPRKSTRFPEEWKMKPERVQALLQARKEQRLLADAAPATPPDGKSFVREYVRSLGMKSAPSHRIV